MQPRRAQEKTGSARSPLAVVLDRHLFLHALQSQRPEWWRGFYTAMNLPEPDRLTVDQWAEVAEVVDPWFIDVLNDTEAGWKFHPDSPRAKLVDGYEWFTYQGRDQTVLPFAPEFHNPWPMLMGESRALETPDEFEHRMVGQFKHAMKKYKTYIRATSTSKSERRRDAHLTALRFLGMSPQEIAQRFPGMMDSNQYSDPEDVIRKAVERFSADIGLTLRSC
jgi:hypothetical protein